VLAQDLAQRHDHVGKHRLVRHAHHDARVIAFEQQALERGAHGFLGGRHGLARPRRHAVRVAADLVRRRIAGERRRRAIVREHLARGPRGEPRRRRLAHRRIGEREPESRDRREGLGFLGREVGVRLRRGASVVDVGL